MSVLAEIRRLGGVARASELADAGIGPGLLRSVVRAGEVLRPRKGWYMDPALGPDVAAAVRVGGALACVSATEHRGVWTLHSAELHLAIPAESSRLRSPGNSRERLSHGSVVLHWTETPTRALESIVAAIARMVRCVGLELAFAAAESAVHLGLIDIASARAALAGAPSWMIRAVGRLSESGTESLLKLMLIRLGIAFEQQVVIPGVGRVDFLVGTLIIEVDSKAWHSDAHRDRARDAAASAHGYRVLRFDFAQVVYDIVAVEAAIVGALIRGDLRV